MEIGRGSATDDEAWESPKQGCQDLVLQYTHHHRHRHHHHHYHHHHHHHHHHHQDHDDHQGCVLSGLRGGVIRLILQIEFVRLRQPLQISNLIEAPPGGSTAAQRFWSKEGCDKGKSLAKQSFEFLFFS